MRGSILTNKSHWTGIGKQIAIRSWKPEIVTTSMRPDAIKPREWVIEGYEAQRRKQDAR